VIEVGRLRLHTIATPGTPRARCAFGGGLAGAVQRRHPLPRRAGCHQVPGGDFPTIIRSIEDRLFRPLPADTLVLPGHGDDTTIGPSRPHLQEWIDRGW
jgi:hypothetical protein